MRLGAQNCHWEPEGPYTGEISPTMLRDLAEYVLIGHSERRAAGETDQQIAKKVLAAAESGLTPVLFVGEESSDGSPHESERRLTEGLSRVDLERHDVLVVYEPAWAIGADRAAESDQVREIVGRLKARLRRLGARRPEVIYGGTVTQDNVEQFTRLETLDGVGATRSSLDAREFLGIVDRVGQAAEKGPPAE